MTKSPTPKLRYIAIYDEARVKESSTRPIAMVWMLSRKAVLAFALNTAVAWMLMMGSSFRDSFACDWLIPIS
ncbi:hypothetical protein D9M68_713350 [compost metagenome]